MGHRADHDPFRGATADPLDAHDDPLAPALHVHHDPLNYLADEFFAIYSGGRWGCPQGGNVRRQATNGRALRLGKHARLLLHKAMVVLLYLLLGG